MRQLTVFLFFFAFYLTQLQTNVFGADEFSTFYDVSYLINEKGETRVTQEVTIENLTSRYFVSEYEFKIGSADPTNITAWDPTGPLAPTVEKGQNETKITLHFKARVVGVGNKLTFGVSYDFPNLAVQNGLIWELNLFRISGLETISSYTLSLYIPKSFGPPLYSSPSPVKQTQSSSSWIISFNKAALLKGAPRLGFGEFQLYKLNLTYHLKNPHLGLGYTEIALPPDILGYQQVFQTTLLPSPSAVRVDEDGNYLARYNLGPLEKKEVIWEGLLALFYTARELNPNPSNANIPQDLIQKYTSTQKYWETEAVELRAQAAQITDPNLSTTENLRRIYDFVTSNLSYDYQKLESGELIRLGALSALAQKDKAVCMEYTDLFIALARASGVPAREINGFAYTADRTNRPLSLKIQSGDVLHAWPQVYLPGFGWAMVDPTWGSTSGSDYFSVFDLSHLAFVLKGENSEYPLPAGSYKTNPNQKDVSVALTTDKEILKENPNLEVRIDFQRYAVSPFPISATLAVKNPSKTSLFNVELSLKSDLLKLLDTKLNFGTIPPGATLTKTVNLLPENALTTGEETLEAIALAKDFSGKEVISVGLAKSLVRPLYFPLGPIELGLLIIISASFFLVRRILRI